MFFDDKVDTERLKVTNLLKFFEKSDENARNGAMQIFKTFMLLPTKIQERFISEFKEVLGNLESGCDNV